MTVNIFNLLILIGAIHGLVLSLLLFCSKRNARSSNILLGLLLTFYTLPVLRTVLQDLAFFKVYGYWFLSIELLFGLGPLLFLYSKSVTDPEYRFGKKDFIHFIPVVLELGYYASAYYRHNNHYYFGSARDGYHLFWMLQQGAAITSILIYLGLTNRLLWSYATWVKSQYSETRRRTLDWLKKPVLLYSLFFGLWFSLRVLDVLFFQDRMAMEPYYPLLVFLAFSTYWIGTRGFLENQVHAVGFAGRHEDPLAMPVIDKDLHRHYEALQRLMAEEKPYLDNDLKLPQLAESLGLNPRVLSKVINSEAKMNFYDFINSYRIEAFKHQIQRPDHQGNMLDLAFECGFGSKATFNHVFKKQTGLTPSQFKKQCHAREKQLDA